MDDGQNEIENVTGALPVRVPLSGPGLDKRAWRFYHPVKGSMEIAQEQKESLHLSCFNFVYPRDSVDLLEVCGTLPGKGGLWIRF